MSLTSNYPAQPPASSLNPPGGKPRSRAVLNILLLLVTGALLSLATAYFLVKQEWVGLLSVVLLLPLLAFYSSRPFYALLIYLLLFPIVIQSVFPGSRSIYWLIHRGMIPAGLIAVLFFHALGIRKLKALRIDLIDWVMLSFLVYSTANILWLSQDPGPSVVRFYDRIVIPFCVYWFMRLVRPTEHELSALVPVAFITIYLQGAVGVTSWFAPGLLPEEWLGRFGERTVGTLNNPAVYTTTLIFMALILIQFAQQTASRTLRWLALMTAGIGFFFVFFSFSRGSWLGAVVVLAGLTWLYPKYMLRLGLVGAVLGVFALTTFLASFTAFAAERLTTESTVEGRLIGGSTTARMIAQKPVLGWGYDNHEVYDEQFRSGVLGLVANAQHTSHNTILLITAEMGLAGLSLYFLPTFAWLAASLLRWKALPIHGFMGRRMLFLLWLLLADHFLPSLFTDMIRSNFFNTVIWWMVLAWIANIVTQPIPGPLAQPVGQQPLQTAQQG